MRARNVAMFIAFSYFFWGFAKDGTLGAMIDNVAKGASITGRGLSRRARTI